MADPRNIVPYEDFYDSSIAASILNFAEDQNPTLADLQEPVSVAAGELTPMSQLLDVGNHGVGISSSPLESLSMVELMYHFNSSERRGSEAGHDSSNVHGGGEGMRSNVGEEEFDTEMPIPSEVQSRILTIWPVTPVPFLCSCCHVLREIIHSNGINSRKLEIHGRLGMICHAILEHKPIVNIDNFGPQYQMFDFCDKSSEEIKQFILQYCLKQILEDYNMMPDPMSNFYDALCVGMDWFENLNTDGFFQLSPDNSEEDDMDQPDTEHEPTRPSLASQRRRTGKMTVNDVLEYLHLPISEASKKLNVCNTVLKKICRRSGLSRWPYRKIRSYERRITALKATMNSSYGDTRARAEAEIQRVQQELADFCARIRI